MAEIGTQELKEWIDTGQDFVLVDTLPPTAFEKGHIPGAIHIMSDDILARAPALLPDKGARIVVYCASETCKRAQLSAGRLESLGYSRVYHYVGGKRAWREAGHGLSAGAEA